MGTPSKPSLALLAVAMAHKAHKLEPKRKRGRPKKTLLGAEPRYWKKKEPPKRPKGRFTWTFENKCLLVEVLAEKMLETGTTSWEEAARQLVDEGVLTRSIKVESLARQARAARKDPAVRAAVLARLPAAARFFAPQIR
jgi:hypothetical protein